jgi:crotonobetainyl-CoA:carnitine CoA-transferase CaiB-like acyl-CoA transferase
VRHRQHRGGVARIDFSMIEAMLWTMAEPILATQLGSSPRPQGNRSDLYAPHGVYRCAGDDDWISLVIRSDEEWRRLCEIVPALAPMSAFGFSERVERRAEIDDALSAWVRPRPAETAAQLLLGAGIPAAPLATSRDLVTSDHLRERGFWDAYDSGVLPGFPWQTNFCRTHGAAPALGADTDTVLHEVVDLSPDEIAACADRAPSVRSR